MKPKVHVHVHRPRPVGDSRTHDAQHWITVHPHGEDGEGQPVLIEGSGGSFTIVGGAGGKLNGKTVSPGSMSGARPGTEAPKDPQRAAYEAAHSRALAASAAAQTMEEHRSAAGMHGAANNTRGGTPEEYASHHPAQKKHMQEAATLQGRAAIAQADAAKTPDEHREAFKALSDAAAEMERAGNREAAKPLREKGWNHYQHYLSGREAQKAAAKKAEADAVKQRAKEAKAATAGTPKGEAAKRFAKTPVAEVQKHFESKYGLEFTNGSDADKRSKATYKEYGGGLGKSQEELDAVSQRYLKEREEVANHPALAFSKHHSSIDIDSTGVAAKRMRVMLGHVDDALAGLEARGFDVKTALSKGKVSLLGGEPKDSDGHAWQGMHGKGYFAMNTKTEDAESIDRRARNIAARKAANKGLWTVGTADGADYTHAAIVHEMAHALGLQPHIGSPAKLQTILNKIVPGVANNTGAVRAWVREHISEYASSNIKETDAELCAMVTGANYKRGTLPKELEDHVDALFHKRKD